MAPITATTARGRVMRKTEPHQNFSSMAPAANGPRAAIAPPTPDHRAIERVRPGPDHSAVMRARVVGKAMPAARPPKSRAATEDRQGRRPRRRDRRGDGQRGAEHQHHLAAVAVAEGTEPQHRRGQAERVADGDDVEPRLGGVEGGADVGEGHVGHREVQVGDGGDEDQGGEHRAGRGAVRSDAPVHRSGGGAGCRRRSRGRRRGRGGHRDRQALGRLGEQGGGDHDGLVGVVGPEVHHVEGLDHRVTRRRG